MTAVLATDSTFVAEERWSIPPDFQVSAEREWTFYSFWSVNREGTKAAFIDLARHEVCVMDLRDEVVKSVARHTSQATHVSFSETAELEAYVPSQNVDRIAAQGAYPGDVNLPSAVVWTGDGNLFVSDAGSRRVSVFDADEAFRFSFLLPPDMDTPWDCDLLGPDTLLLSCLVMSDPQDINAGFYCNVVDTTGKWLQAYAYTPDIAFSKRLWTGVSSSVETDEQGNTFVVFSVDPTIYIFDRNGKLTGTIGDRPDWWVGPHEMLRIKGDYDSPPEGHLTSWTRIVKLVRLADGRLIRVAEANGFVPGCTSRFVIDVFSREGQHLGDAIYSDYWPVGACDDGSVFLLSVDGSDLVRASCTVGR
jgi:hypothetical protein